MMLKKIVYEGELRPFGYRAAYANFASFSYTCYPIGIHLVFRLSHRIWEWTCLYNPSKLEKMQRRAFKEGRREGMAQIVRSLRVND